MSAPAGSTVKPAADSAAEAVIGLEVHVQLRTRAKLFCACRAELGVPPNTQVCPVCMGLPGALPVLNGEAVEMACRTALGLGARVNRTSAFDRRHAFDPALPKGYRITQRASPLATGGSLEVPGADGGARRIALARMHLGEDAGQAQQGRVPGATAVDLNRAGFPLLEIVTEPTLASAPEARAFVVRLRQALEYLEVSGCSMAEGSMRLDCSVSLRDGGRPGGGTTIRGLDSLDGLAAAVEGEVARQRGVLAAGGRVEHRALEWDGNLGQARATAEAERPADWWMPEPDLPPLVLDDAWLRSLELGQPQLPGARSQRFVDDYGLPPEHAAAVTGGRDFADYFEAVARSGADPREAAAWVMGDVRAALDASGGRVVEFPVRPQDLAQLLAMVSGGILSRELARRVFARMLATGKPAAQIVADEGLIPVRDAGAVDAWVDQVLADHPDEAARVRAGEDRLMGFLVAQVMERSGSRAEPTQVAERVRAKLGAA
ncbi:MAG: gatB [Gemmatimonadetes bacterium]|nr:gatB [Gemmatimonadota bacterium]